ncbi:SMC-Scp complex subunit ScpB [Kribbella sp. NPDC059898]|uniref:SMC-Scp complex subunit ScpB n=1 Tax=Kribbella sp. NPDC059898 TaxID=3346995 RepID=UPI0036487F89
MTDNSNPEATPTEQPAATDGPTTEAPEDHQAPVAADADQTPTSTDQPTQDAPTAGNEADEDDRTPLADDETPPASTDQSAPEAPADSTTTDAADGADEADEASGDGRGTTGNGRGTTGNGRGTTGNGRGATGNGDGAVDGSSGSEEDEQPSTADDQPTPAAGEGSDEGERAVAGASAGGSSGGGDEEFLPAGQMVLGDEVVVDDDTMRRAVEAILMVTDEPLPVLTLARAVGRPTGDIAAALAGLAAEYTEQGRGFDLREVGGGWRYYTRPEAAQYVERFVLDGQQSRITQAALETLAVVAYKQPVSRARVSAIRGVNVDGVMRTLVARGLVEEAGADTESQATLYRTTTYFLERMGMQSLDDLPELAPYLPEMDDIEEELAAQALPPTSSPEDGEAAGEPAAEQPHLTSEPSDNADDELEPGTPQPATSGDVTPDQAPTDEPADDAQADDALAEEALADDTSDEPGTHAPEHVVVEDHEEPTGAATDDDAVGDAQADASEDESGVAEDGGVSVEDGAVDGAGVRDPAEDGVRHGG